MLVTIVFGGNVACDYIWMRVNWTNETGLYTYTKRHTHTRVYVYIHLCIKWLSTVTLAENQPVLYIITISIAHSQHIAHTYISISVVWSGNKTVFTINKHTYNSHETTNETKSRQKYTLTHFTIVMFSHDYLFISWNCISLTFSYTLGFFLSLIFSIGLFLLEAEKNP